MDWRKLGWKAIKTAAVAGVAVILAAPDLTPSLLALVPEKYRMLGAVLIPAVLTALRNWSKHSA